MTDTTLPARLRSYSAERLRGIHRGIEKESLRAAPNGALALTPHPAALGSALTHPHITTDYSESLVEMITGVHAGVDDCLTELTRVHQFVYRSLAALGNERLWVGSMPCGLPTDETIPLARYGSSNVSRAKSVYRMGLGHRYGRRMQTIAGIHYNWSLPDLSNDDHFALIRNFRRRSFLLLLLFGASPAACRTFVEGRDHGLQTLTDGTRFLPHATSLRMGRLGYKSDAQAALAVSYNCLDSYAESLQEALSRPYPDYERLGVQGPGGDYMQLATTLLQIENEFYGTIRPKRVIRAGERPLHALRARGVEYIEVRCMDLDPFEPVGIAAQTMRFLDVFLLHCLVSESPPDTPEEVAGLGRNQNLTAEQGREPGLMLEREGGSVAIADWAAELLTEAEPVARALDAAHRSTDYSAALAAAQLALRNPETLPSARMLTTMARDFGSSYTGFMCAQAEQTRNQSLALPWNDELQAQFEAMSERSDRARESIEAADTVDFETYRQEYVAPQRMLA